MDSSILESGFCTITDANEGRLISIYTVCHSVFDFYNEMPYGSTLFAQILVLVCQVKRVKC